MPIPSKLLELLRLRWLSLSVIGLCVGYAITVLTRAPTWSLPLLALVWLGLGALFRWGAPTSPAYRYVPRKWCWWLLPIALWGLYI